MREIYEKLLVESDVYELNPLLEPEKKAHIKVTGIAQSGEQTKLDAREIRFQVTTERTSGDKVVATIDEQGCVTPLEGGIVSISVETMRYGHRAQGSCEIVVRPFYHQYHKTLTAKFFLGMEDAATAYAPCHNPHQKPCDVIMTFEDVLETIQKIDKITCGVPKIVYLVGWQAGGHDHGYPGFDEVNPKLKRACDKSAADSLRWLIREGFHYHTAVSLHINLNDSYSYSKWYQAYDKLGILMNDQDWALIAPEYDLNFARTKLGEKMRMGKPVLMTPFWQIGMFRKRMDELIAMLPELVDTHTIHFDNWVARDAPRQGVCMEDEEAAMRRMFLYMRDKGFDITSEGSYHGRTDPMVGLQPLSWWDHVRSVPAALYCGGRTSRFDGDPRIGDSIMLEDILADNYYKDRDFVDGIQTEFCLYTLPWLFLNHHRLISFDGVTAAYSDDVTATLEDGIPVIRQRGIIIRRGTTLFVPLIWKTQREIMVYSLRSGFMRTRLPNGWEDVRSVDLYDIDEMGRYAPQYFHSIPVDNSIIDVHLRSRQALILRPAGEATSRCDRFDG